MTSNRPYLIRAIHQWIGDNDMTPYLLVDAAHPDLAVPSQAIKDGRVVLNIAARAVSQLSLGDAEIAFLARFGGVSHSVRIPVAAVLAVYAQESGQGMALPDEAQMPSPQVENQPEGPTDAPPGGSEPRRGSHLRIVK